MLKKKIILLLSIALTTACSTVVEHVRIEVSEDLASSIQVLVSEAVNSANIKAKHQALGEYAERAKACGALTKIFGGIASEVLYLQVNIQLKTRDEIDVAGRCAIFKKTYPRLIVGTSNNLFAKVYNLDFEMQAGARDGFSRNFPREFTFTLPGTIVDVYDDSEAIAYDITKTMNGDNSITLHIEPFKKGSEAEKLIQRKVCGNQKPNCIFNVNDIPESMRYATLKLSLRAENSKYDLKTIVTVLGLLFGSGVVFEISKKLLSRNQKNG